MEKKKYKAIYRRKGANPFVAVGPRNQIPRGDLVSITVSLSNDTPVSEIERLAKEATPKGYEFARVELVG